jgi:glycosyltransferase involved in cell wall biosynthesis/GT2 family glycosyltransferase
MIPFVQLLVKRRRAKPELAPTDPMVEGSQRDESRRVELPPPLAPRGALPWENNARPGPPEWASADLSELPTFTLVTPCFNSVEFLEKTIRSVLLQGYPKLEWFIIDAASNDGTVDVIRYYQKFITKWVSENDDGQSDALNKGFAQASGDILCWLNADDLFLLDALFAVARAWIENDRADFIVADADLVDGNLRYINHQSYSDMSPESLIDYRKNYLIQPGVFFSRRAWARCGPLATNLHYAMDFDLFYRMAGQFPPVRCRTKVALSVFHPKCKTVRSRVFSIIETALLQAKFGRDDIAARELVEIGKEHKFLEDHFHQAKRRRKILFVISELGLGGAQTFLLRLLRDFANDHDVYLYVYFKHSLTSQFAHLVPAQVMMLTEFDLGDPKALRKMTEVLKIQIVFSHLYHADRLCHFALRDTGIPMIVTDHGDFKIVDQIGVADFEEVSNLLERAHTIIVTSQAGAASFERFGAGITAKLTQIPLGVDLVGTRGDRAVRRKLLDVSEETFVFMCSARGVPEKGWVELFEAFTLADATATTPIELWCLGSGPAIDRIKDRAAIEGRGNVRFFGFQRNVQDYLAAVDCVVLLSKFRGETLNLSIMEAFPMGLPVIAADIGAISETVGRGPEAAGILIPLSPATQAASVELAVDAMVRMVEDRDLRASFAKAALKRASDFDMRKVSEQTIALMDWAIATPRARGGAPQ